MSFQQSGFSAKCCAAKLKPEVHNMSRIMRKPAFCIYDFSIKNYVVDCKFCHDKDILKSTHSMTVFYGELTKIILKLSSNTHLIY